MILPQDCCVTGIENVYEQLKTFSNKEELYLDSQAVVHLDLSFLQCLKALEKQNIKVILDNPSEAVKSFCKLYRTTHFIEDLN